MKIFNQIVQFYRNEYGLNFSNGIIFTTQSKDKSNKFLLNKISEHIKKWNNDEKNVLNIGSIDSYRNIIHPYDVSTAIKIILNEKKGSDYLICNYSSNKISDLVELLYKNANIELTSGLKENVFYEKNTNKAVLNINNIKNGLDTKSIDINGYPYKLSKLNWNIKYSITDILKELI